MMKKIFFLTLMLCYSIFIMAQKSRWKQFLSADTNNKMFIDTTRTQKIIGFDGRGTVVIVWVKLMAPLKQNGVPKETLDKFAVDVEESQIELKSASFKVNGIEEQHQIDTSDWKDILPESQGEVILAYCKDYLKSSGETR